MLEFIKTHKTGIIAVTVVAVATIAIILTGAKIYKHKNANPTNTSSVSSNPIDDFILIPEPNQSKQGTDNPKIKKAKKDVASSKNKLNQVINNKKQKPISNSKLPRNMQSHNNRSKNKNKAATALRLNQKPKSKK